MWSHLLLPLLLTISICYRKKSFLSSLVLQLKCVWKKYNTETKNDFLKKSKTSLMLSKNEMFSFCDHFFVRDGAGVILLIYFSIHVMHIAVKFCWQDKLFFFLICLSLYANFDVFALIIFKYFLFKFYLTQERLINNWQLIFHYFHELKLFCSHTSLERHMFAFSFFFFFLNSQPIVFCTVFDSFVF